MKVTVLQKMAVTGALVFHKHIFFPLQLHLLKVLHVFKKCMLHLPSLAH